MARAKATRRLLLPTWPNRLGGQSRFGALDIFNSGIDFNVHMAKSLAVSDISVREITRQAAPKGAYSQRTTCAN